MRIGGGIGDSVVDPNTLCGILDIAFGGEDNCGDGGGDRVVDNDTPRLTAIVLIMME